jgi:hypothetical protein
MLNPALSLACRLKRRSTANYEPLAAFWFGDGSINQIGLGRTSDRESPRITDIQFGMRLPDELQKITSDGILSKVVTDGIVFVEPHRGRASIFSTLAPDGPTVANVATEGFELEARPGRARSR